MKAILLAAGRGTRISKSVGIPKSTLPIDDTDSIISHSVGLFLKNGIDVVVVVGYMEDKIRGALRGYPVKYYCNPFFAVTNSAASLWFAKDELEGDVIIGNADVYWEQPMLDLLLKCENDVVMLADESRAEVGDYFFEVKDGYLVDHGKELIRNKRNCEYVGLSKIGSASVGRFKEHLIDLVKTERYDLWWENALYEYRDQMPIHVVDVGELFWSEVDYFQDYECILKYIRTHDSKCKLQLLSLKDIEKPLEKKG